MIGTQHPLTATSSIVELLNVVGAGLILAYIFAHFQQKQAQKEEVERTWRQRSAGILAGFAFYALLVATWGPSETWVATIGSVIDSNIQEFATEVALLGEQGTGSGGESTGLSGQISGVIKLIGLIAYVALFSVLSISTSAMSRLITFFSDLLS